MFKKINQFNWIAVKQSLFTPKHPLRNVVCSILLGVIFGFLVLSIFYGFGNAFQVLESLFTQNFSTSIGNGFTMMLFKCVVMGFAGLSVLIGMRTGFLNIGVSGQMSFGAFIAYAFLNRLAASGTANSGLSLFLGLILTVLGAVVIAMIAGVLKIYFRVNEVISTIMLNWIVVFILAFAGQHFFGKDSNWFASEANGTSLALNSAAEVFTIPKGDNVLQLVIFAICLLVLVCLVVWFMFYKTIFGFKLNAIGKNSQAAEYAGYHRNAKLLYAFLFSGICAGLAAYVNFFLAANQLPVNTQPIGIGFMGIAVALVSLLNPIGLIFSGILFGFLDGPVGGVVLVNLDSQIVQIFSASVTYFVAIILIWQYLKFMDFYRWITHFFRKKNKSLSASKEKT